MAEEYEPNGAARFVYSPGDTKPVRKPTTKKPASKKPAAKKPRPRK